MWSIDKDTLEAMYEKYIDFNFHGRRITEKYYGMNEDHLVLLAMSPRERFEAILERQPWILHDRRITDKMLAAYLGMSRITLSNYRSGKRPL